MDSEVKADLNHPHPAHAHHHPHEAFTPPPPLDAAEGSKWTCPMHPEIVRDAPGDCPICGMALVPIAGTGTGGSEANDAELHDLARRLQVGIVLSIPLVLV